MTAREMHYDFKQKLNKLDSHSYRNLQVPEIDWKLNEAQEVFVKSIAEPRQAKGVGFEINQRTIDDIRTIVTNQTQKRGDCIITSLYDEKSYLAPLPKEYWFRVGAKAIATKGKCKDKQLSVKPVQHDDEHELSVFDRSSFEWGVVNMRFVSEGIRLFTDGSFTINKLCLEFIRRPRPIYNAQDYVNGTYTTMTGEILTGSQSCELPEGTHRDVVDLAVLITSGDLALPEYTLKQNKLMLTN